jgi:hypothetical protein
MMVSKGNEKQSLDYIMTASCQMKFDFEQSLDEQKPDQSYPGFCWFKLFRNPVMVGGYPIPRRLETDTGLEISLGFISLLLASSEVFKVEENVILKGFSSLLIAVEATKDLVMWHLLINSSGERISFCDARIETMSKGSTADLSLRDLESRRHIVGWCNDVKEYSGMQNLASTSSGF